MADRIENLKALADEYNIRSASKLRQQALLDGVNVTLREAAEALKTDLAAQVFAPKPRSLGKSAAEGPNDRLQFDLIDYSNNTKRGNPNRFALVGIDVFTRELAAVPLKTKVPGEVNEAFKKAAGELADGETNYVVTTDGGGEFARLSEAMPEGAVHRQKAPEDKNAIAVLDRNMQSLKVDLAGRIAKKGGDWSAELGKVVNSHNNKPHDAVYGAPSRVEGNGGDNPQMFRVMQDNAAKFVHNRALTQRRMGEIKDAGGFRAPTGNARSFNPQYGNVRRVRAVDSQYVTDTSGRQTLLKQAQPAPEGSTNVRQTLTIPGRALAVRLKGAADQVQTFLASQGAEMPVARLEALVRANGVGLSGVQASVRRNRTTFRRLLALFKTHFTVRNGVVRTAVAAPAAAPVAAGETPAERSARLDRQLAESQRLRDEQDRQREERRVAQRERLRGVAGVYGSRPR